MHTSCGSQQRLQSQRDPAEDWVAVTNNRDYGEHAVQKPSRNRSTAEIRKSAYAAFAPDTSASAVGLRPAAAWTRRNPVTEILLPSLLTKREGRSLRPEWPQLQGNDFALTWIGHASFLLQTAGLNILIDPIWSNWVKGIKRMRNPGVELNALPGIDLVLITHAHFDHLDRRTLRGVAADQPVVVPFEVGNLVHDLGFRVVQELHYWESFEYGPVRVTLTPCHHWGARMLHDSHRGFGGFIIEVAGRVVYHCGDTAYFDGFREIGARFPIDVALLPIGAYDPPSLRAVHMNPEEALEAFIELNAQLMVPMHYGTFRLSYEPLEEPPERLRLAAQARAMQSRIAWMQEGSPMVF
jgi:L-ascorbate metabolism protein UlaG (beta-lactamase superfamily)